MTGGAALDAAVTGGAAALDIAAGAGGNLAYLAADFMARHSGELRALARAGGASFAWLIIFLDWLEPAMKRDKKD